MIFFCKSEKHDLGMKSYALNIFGVLLVLNLLSCGSPLKEELARITSPDGLVDAVLLRVNYHATVTYSYFVYIVEKGKSVKEGDHLFLGTHMENLKISWIETKLLEIQYKEITIHHFENMWHSKNLDNYHYVVELKLSPQGGPYSLSKRNRE